MRKEDEEEDYLDDSESEDVFNVLTVHFLLDMILLNIVTETYVFNNLYLYKYKTCF